MMQNNIYNCDSDTAANFSSASGRSESGLSGSWDVIPPLRNVSIGASFNTLIEEQKKKIKFLTDQLSDFNRVRYKTLPVNSSRRKNAIQTAKKESMTTMDQINQQTFAGVVQAWVDHFVTSLSLHYPYLKVKKTISFHFWCAHLI